MEQLQTALIAIKVLRSSVGQVFDSLGNGLRADHGEENKENKYLLELQELLTTVNVNLRYLVFNDIFTMYLYIILNSFLYLEMLNKL